ncbi:MAG: SDR family oxidoreductase [Actinomycetes bacterium]
MTRVFVAGGAGGVGSGVVAAWLADGATVVTTSRDEERLANLRRVVRGLPGRLIATVAAGDRPGLEQLAAAHGPFDAAIASIGGAGWRLAPLATIEEAMLRTVVEDGIVAHWRVAAALRPHIRGGGSYVFINGGAAVDVVPGTGPLSLVARAQLALAEIFDAEERSGVRTHSLVLTSPIATPARGAHVPGDALTPADVGDACRRLHLAAPAAVEIRVGTRAEIERLGGDTPITEAGPRA